jgi:uncharacterized membrane protein YgcG
MAGSRSLGTLTLDIVAKIGGFERGMDKAEREAQKRSKAIAKAVEDASAIAITAFGALAAAGVAAFAVLNRQADNIAGFQDLAEKIGDTATAVASLKTASDVSGISLETVSAASVRLTASLSKTSDESKGVGEAIGQLGLNFQDFKNLSPVEQIDAVAQAMNGLEDGSKKTAIAVQLFGKSGAELIPFLNDLADGSERQTKLTEEQIRQADEYTKANARLKSEFESFLQLQTGEALPVLTQVQQVLSEIAKNEATIEVVTATLGVALKAAIVIFQTVAVVASDVGFVFLSVGREIGAWAAQIAALGRGDLAGFSAISDAVKEDAARARKELDDFQARIMSIGQPGNGGSSASSSGPSASRAPTVTRPITQYSAEDQKLIEQSARELSDSYQRYYYDPMAAFEEEQTADQKRQTEERNRIFFEAQAAREQEMKQWFESIDAEQEAAIQAGKELLDSYAQDAKRAQEIGNSVAMTFASAFEDAIVTGQKFSEVLKGITQDLIRIAVRQTVTQPLFNSLANLFSSTGGGGGGTSGGTASFDGGGFTGSGARSGGLDGKGGFMAMLHPQETVIDHTKGSYSSMGNVQGSQQMTYAPVYNIDARADRAELLQLVDRSVREGNAQLVDQLQRQGRL